VTRRVESRNLQSVNGYGHNAYALRLGSSSPFGRLIDEAIERLAERVADLLEERARPGADDPAVDLLSVREAAEMLRCKPQRVYDLRSAGRLPRTAEGGRAVVRRSDLERLIAEVVR
jgi:excisionase family DNA binding protein